MKDLVLAFILYRLQCDSFNITIFELCLISIIFRSAYNYCTNKSKTWYCLLKHIKDRRKLGHVATRSLYGSDKDNKSTIQTEALFFFGRQIKESIKGWNLSIHTCYLGFQLAPSWTNSSKAQMDSTTTYKSFTPQRLINHPHGPRPIK